MNKSRIHMVVLPSCTITSDARRFSVVGCCPEHCRALSRIPGAYTLNDSSSRDNQNTKINSRHCQMSLGDTETHVLVPTWSHLQGILRKERYGIAHIYSLLPFMFKKKKRKNIFCYITACIFISSFKKDTQETGNTGYSWGKGN